MQSWKAGSRGTQILKIMKPTFGYRFANFFIHELTQSVFVGFHGGGLNQTNLRSQKIIKKYQNIKIGPILYLSSYNNLLCLGGNCYRFCILDITKRKVLLYEDVHPWMRNTISFHFTVIKRNNNPIVALAVSGRKSLLLYLYFKLTIESSIKS